jgi:hypothetical protein
MYQEGYHASPKLSLVIGLPKPIPFEPSLYGVAAEEAYTFWTFKAYTF